jgi:hypothetical protein
VLCSTDKFRLQRHINRDLETFYALLSERAANARIVEAAKRLVAAIDRRGYLPFADSPERQVYDAVKAAVQASVGSQAVNERVEPWHDTVMHDDCGGPVIPSREPPNNQANWVRCAACGDIWSEDNPLKLARIWWSAGAQEGRQRCVERGHK